MKTNKFPGETDEAHPEVFNTIPAQPEVKKPGQLNQKQLASFFNDGYLVLEDYFNTKEDLDPIKNEFEKLVDDLAQKLYRHGKVKDLYENEDFFHRLTKLERDFPGANLVLTKLGGMPEALQRLWTHDRLLNIMEQILGTSEILGNPVWNLRTKTPQNEATTVPWHQDAGYCDNDSYKVLIPTAWIPLLDATKENGCLQFYRGGHRTGRVARHECCWGDTHYVMLPEAEIAKTLEVDLERDLVTCEIPYGSMVIFNNLIPHRSLNNLSDKIRWSVDLRWQRADQPIGFYGLKEGVLMRSSNDPQPEIDWDTFNGVDRHTESFDHPEEEKKDQFSTLVVGPWMKKWEITHHNRHTIALMGE